MESHHPERRESFEAVRRNINRTRVRLGLEQEGSRAGTNGDSRDVGGNIAHDPPNAKLVPPTSHETLVAHFASPILDPTRGAERGGITGDACPNPNALNRDGK